jgi:hypothetical protein
MGQLFRNILLGIGQGLIKEGELNEQRERDDLLMRRQIALKQLEFQHDDAQAATTHQNRLDEITATAAETRRSELFKGVIDERRDENKAKRDLDHDIKIKAIDFSNDAKLEQLRNKLGMSRDQFQSTLTQMREDHKADTTIDHWVVSPRGEVGGYNSKGKLISQTKPGTTTVPGSSSSGDSFADLDPGTGGIAPSSARTQAEPTPKVTPQPQVDSESVLSQLSKMPPPPDGKVGRTMTGPNGMTAKWNGKTWVLGDVGG